MRKTISLIIIASFLFTNATYAALPDTLRPNLMLNKGKGAERINATSYEVALEKVATWIVNTFDVYDSTDYSDKIQAIERIVAELKAGKYSFGGQVGDMSDRSDIKIDFLHNTLAISKTTGSFDWDYTWWENTESGTAKQIPEDILKLASETLGLNVRPISKVGIEHLESKTDDLISWQSSVWRKKVKNITEEDIGIYLRSLATNAPIKDRVKRTITKKLQKLQQKRPETIPIIRAKALGLLEIDEANFREGFGTFMGGYIVIRDGLKEKGVDTGSEIFYALFDKIVKISKREKNISLFMSSLTPSHIKEVAEMEKNFGDFSIKHTYVSQLTHTEVNQIIHGASVFPQGDDMIEVVDRKESFEIQILPPIVATSHGIQKEEHDLVMSKFDDSLPGVAVQILEPRHIAEALNFRKLYGDFTVQVTRFREERYEVDVRYPGREILSYGDVGYGDPDLLDAHYEREQRVIPERVMISIKPLAKLSNFKQIPVLFSATEVALSPNSFKNALSKLKTN
ncbi:MAG: hypothetical protein KKD11_08055, partial [Candidatus Omnitrophica bacterium]|nr:hypothetical protein [Candidatus Omnitrophota bacterium]